jgi:hypothetical protein
VSAKVAVLVVVLGRSRGAIEPGGLRGFTQVAFSKRDHRLIYADDIVASVAAYLSQIDLRA